MSPAPPYLRLEQNIAIAHRSLWRAVQLGHDLNLDGLADDLEQILQELQRLQVDLLRGPRSLNRTQRRRTYLYSVESHGDPAST